MSGARARWLPPARALLLAAAALAGPAAHAGLGVTQLAAAPGDGPVTVFYPTATPDTPQQRGPFALQLAPEAPPARGNGRLVVVSHGSGAAPWVQVDIARALAEAGFVVALPEHQGDNARDHGQPGPPTWQRRPGEVSRAIDAVQQDPRFGPALDLRRVGAWGMSAGGRTVLVLAGAAWSPAGFRDHCLAQLRDDWYGCAPVWMDRPQGSWSLREPALRAGLAALFRDPTLQVHHDPRIAAAVAGVPVAADLDLSALAMPRIPLALVTAQRDLWLPHPLHAARVLAACQPRCALLADLPTGGHGALLSPPPPAEVLAPGVRTLLADPPGFDRAAELPPVHAKIAAFFRRHLLDVPPTLPTADAVPR